MAQFKVVVSVGDPANAGSDKLLVLTNTDPLESASEQIQAWAKETYHGNVVTSTEKLNNSNEVFVSDLTHEKYHKVIFL